MKPVDRLTEAEAADELTALAAERSWTSFINLLEELFAGHG
jgi:hypothetical protein